MEPLTAFFRRSLSCRFRWRFANSSCIHSRFASLSSQQQAFFAVSRRHFRSCSWHESFKASEVVVSSRWRRRSWRIHSNRGNEAKPSRFTVSLPYLHHPSDRRLVAGSPTTTRGDRSSTSICPLAYSPLFWSAAWSRTHPGSRQTAPI